MRQALLEWFDKHKRDLPWRRTRDPYAIWLSEVMLQQTQVSTVVPYWLRFLQRFPTVESLARASVSDVLAQWRGLGYYSRARHLHAAAVAIAARQEGFPTRAKALAELPGFGRYTAGAVASIAFGEEVPVVDGNVSRVLSRLFLVEEVPGDKSREKRLWAIAGKLVTGKRPGDWNQALMELGALVCRVADPLCLLCPLRSYCRAHRAGRAAELPPPRPKRPRKELRLAVAVWQEGRRLLLGRRHEVGLFGGLWELPAKEMGSDATQVPSTLGHAVGVNVQVIEPIGTLCRTLTHRDLKLELYRVKGEGPPKPTATYEKLRWVPLEDVHQLGMSSAMAAALQLIMPGEEASP